MTTARRVHPDFLFVHRAAALSRPSTHLKDRPGCQQLWELGRKVVAVLEEASLVAPVEQVPEAAGLASILGCSRGRHGGRQMQITGAEGRSRRHHWQRSQQLTCQLRRQVRGFEQVHQWLLRVEQVASARTLREPMCRRCQKAKYVR